MDYRLLVDLDAIAVLDSLPKPIRTRLLNYLVKRSSPDQYSDCHEQDRIEVNVLGGYSIHYWIDFPDRHVKVFAIKPADR